MVVEALETTLKRIICLRVAEALETTLKKIIWAPAWLSAHTPATTQPNLASGYPLQSGAQHPFPYYLISKLLSLSVQIKLI